MLTHLILISALAHVISAFEFPSAVPLDKRQQPGTPQYECHEDCGGVITLARTENFCESANFTSSLEACLECAQEFDIWKYYGESVSAAARACGVDATPVAGNGIVSSTVGESGSSATVQASSTSGSASATPSASSTGSETATDQTSSVTSESASAATSANASPESFSRDRAMMAIAVVLGILV